MVVSAAVLMRERGARGTSLDAVLAHSGAPRGSIYHHFPGGREELLREATAYAGEYVARKLERHDDGDPLAPLQALFDEYRRNLLDTDFRAGCPVVAVAIESSLDGPDLAQSAMAAFDRWRQTIAKSLERAGVSHARADELAVHAVAAFEGAIILSRAYRDLEPLDRVCEEVRRQVQAELQRLNKGGPK
jgi:AcrR family transcriptional regulator